jgi:hypothetical protein
MQRRKFMKAVGSTAAIGGAITGGSVLFGSAAAQSNLTIDANDVGPITNDRGDLARVTIDPELTISWDNFDEAVGAVFVAIEARAREDGEFGDWSPIFRTTPWLVPNDRINGDQYIEYTKPGTTGSFSYTSIVNAIERAEATRGEPASWSPVDENGGIIVANEAGRPDYESVLDANTLNNYLGGNSIGNTPSTVASELGKEQLANGVYGPAFGTENLDVEEDGTSDADQIELRYTVELLEVSLAIFRSVTGYDAPANATPTGGENGETLTPEDIYTELESLYDEQAGEWAGKDGVSLDNADWFEYVEPRDITVYAFSNGAFDPSEYYYYSQHEPPMNGEEYPDVGSADDGEYAATTRDLGQLRAASNNPAIMVANSTFTVTVQNEQSSSDASGATNPQASGSGQ